MAVATIFAYNETHHPILLNLGKPILFLRLEGQKVTAVAMKKLLSDKFGLSPEHFSLRAIRVYKCFDFFVGGWKSYILSGASLEGEAEIPPTFCESSNSLQAVHDYTVINFSIRRCADRIHCPEEG